MSVKSFRCGASEVRLGGKQIIASPSLHLPLLDVHAVGHVEKREPLRRRDGRGSAKYSVAERLQQRQSEVGATGTEKSAATWSVHGFGELDCNTGTRIRWNGTLSQTARTMVWKPNRLGEARPVISRTAVLSSYVTPRPSA